MTENSKKLSSKPKVFTDLLETKEKQPFKKHKIKPISFKELLDRAIGYKKNKIRDNVALFV